MNDILLYDTYIVAFSGGKDSTASFLWLLDQGVPTSKIELWHHLIDGPEASFMDWPVTEDYCRKFAEAFGVKIYFSWLEGGFEREMLRKDQPKAPTYFQTPYGLKKAGGKGGNNTRMLFPQVSPDLSVRWCSAYLKRDVYEIALNNQDRFNNSRTLVLTGERAEESSARAGYHPFEISRCDHREGNMKRHVDHMRPIHGWSEQMVWEIIEQHKVIVHPCYYIGFGRCSCQFCIFGNPNQMASAYVLSPGRAAKIYDYETLFGKTIKRNIDFASHIYKGQVYEGILRYPHFAMQAVSFKYTFPIFTNHWQLPLGAYGESTGPT